MKHPKNPERGHGRVQPTSLPADRTTSRSDPIPVINALAFPPHPGYNADVPPGAIGFDRIAAVVVACPGRSLGLVKKVSK
jgi:hypothetical protein